MARLADTLDARTNDGFVYDVAFSFLATDLATAHDLADRLSPALRTFVYDREGESVLGGDGMERFSKVFKEEARLSVVLFRNGWGRTPWTALEEVAIKERALRTRFTSFVPVVLADAVALPIWIPRFMLYVSDENNTRSEAAAVIRARAQETGASLRATTAVDEARAYMRAERSLMDRIRVLSSEEGVRRAMDAVQDLNGAISALASEIRSREPKLPLEHETTATMSYLVSPFVSTTTSWEVEFGNSLSGSLLQVNSFAGCVALPSYRGPVPATRLDATDSYRFTLDENNGARWANTASKPKLNLSGSLPAGMTSAALADKVVQRHIARYFSALAQRRASLEV